MDTRDTKHAPAIASENHHHFAKLIARGRRATDAYLEAGFKSASRASAANAASRLRKRPGIAALIGKYREHALEKLADSDTVLELADLLAFFARAVRTSAARVDAGSDLCQHHRVYRDGTAAIRMPCKLRAAKLYLDYSGLGQKAKAASLALPEGRASAPSTPGEFPPPREEAPVPDFVFDPNYISPFRVCAPAPTAPLASSNPAKPTHPEPEASCPGATTGTSLPPSADSTPPNPPKSAQTTTPESSPKADSPDAVTSQPPITPLVAYRRALLARAAEPPPPPWTVDPTKLEPTLYGLTPRGRRKVRVIRD